MLSLLHSSFCGSDSVNVANRISLNLRNKNFQQNDYSNNNGNFEENIKMENDRISVIMLKSPPLPPINPIQPRPSHRRSSFQKLFSKNYPDFFRNYCLCINRKIEPDDPIEIIDPASSKYETDNNPNHTPIIPITVALGMYVVYFVNTNLTNALLI